MSNLRTLPISPREIYTECYRFVRLINSGRASDVPIISPFNTKWMPFTNALISYNNRGVRHNGWTDQYRKWQFRNLYVAAIYDARYDSPDRL